MDNEILLDLIITADVIHTNDDKAEPTTAIGIRDGVIAVTGTRTQAVSWGDASCPRLDYGTATITPGLTDSHSHAISGATTTALGVELAGAMTRTEVIKRLQEEASRTPEGSWVQGWSLDPNVFAGDAVTGQILVEAVGDRAVFVRFADGHSALVTPEALRLAGVTGPRTFPSRSEIVCDDSGVPTGLLLESDAQDAVLHAMPKLTFDEQGRALRHVLEEMAATGLTCLHLMNFEEESITLLDAMEQDAPLPLRLRCSPFFQAGAPLTEELERVIALQGRHGERWVVDGVKLMLDGTVDLGTAWLHEPDTHGESTASLWLNVEDYRHAVHTLAKQGISTATHATGDAAILEAVTAIESIPDSDRSKARHRIEHIETMPGETLERFVASGATASAQPTFSTLYVWPDHTDSWSVRLGHIRAEVNGFRYRELFDADVTVALGSDWPITPYDPRKIIADAQLRRPHDRPKNDRVLAHQALTSQMAIDGYTKHAAYSVGWESQAGSISVGKYADLTIFAEDPITTDAESFASTEIVATVIAGQVLSHS